MIVLESTNMKLNKARSKLCFGSCSRWFQCRIICAVLWDLWQDRTTRWEHRAEQLITSWELGSRGGEQTDRLKGVDPSTCSKAAFWLAWVLSTRLLFKRFCLLPVVSESGEPWQYAHHDGPYSSCRHVHLGGPYSSCRHVHIWTHYSACINVEFNHHPAR